MLNYKRVEQEQFL